MSTAQIDSSSVFLVSGGARGITAKCVIRLAETSPCRWILLGRSQLTSEPDWAADCFEEAELKKRIMLGMQAEGQKAVPKAVQQRFRDITLSREIRETLGRLKQLGSEAEYLSADVTDLAGLRQALEPALARLGKITGIIHGAGNLADKWIENKTEQDFECVYAAKVQGLENLLQCVSVHTLEHLVLFSSVAGFFGSAGQSDYALANEILNKSAHLIKQQNPKCHVVSINWGPWDSGMVTPELKRAFASRGIDVIPIEIGTQMLVRELSPRYQSEAQVVIGSPIVPSPAPLNSELHSYRIHRKLTVDTNPFVVDHSIAGYPVLPATCAASWLILTCERLYPGYSFASLENFKVLKGIVFDATLPEQFTVDVQETVKDNEEIAFEVRIWSVTSTGKPRFHYSGQVKLRSHLPPAPTNAAFELPTAPPLPAQHYYQNKVLFHERRFQGIQSIMSLTPKGLIAHCSLTPLSERDQGQFPVQTFNPYITDLFLQTILIWLEHYHQVPALPTEIQQITQFREIAFDQPFYLCLEIQQKTDLYCICDITAHTTTGEVCVRMSSVKATLSDRLSQKFGKADAIAVATR